MKEPAAVLVLEAPAGLIRVRAECEGGNITRVSFRNVPAFAVHLDREIDVPHLGRAVVDVAYGGMLYVIADATAFGLRLAPEEGGEIVRVGEMIKAAAREQLPVVHPDQPGFAGITIAVLSGPPTRPDARLKKAVVVSTGKLDWDRPSTWTGAIDRSPCGKGTSAKMAALHAKGQLGLGEDFGHEGILGTMFTGRLVEETAVGPTGPSCRRSAAGPGSPGSRATSSKKTTPSPRASPSAISGEDPAHFVVARMLGERNLPVRSQ